MTRTKSSRRRVTGAVVVSVSAAFAVSALITAPADAATTTSAGSAYATPLAALHGQTLAQYVAAHHAANPRLRAHF
jgi:hypothetical protein